MATEKVEYIFDADTKQMVASINGVKTSMKDFESQGVTSAKKVGDGLTNLGGKLKLFSSAGALALGGIAKLGLENEAGAKRFAVVFGDSTDRITKKFNELNGAVRVTEGEFKTFTASIGDVLNPLGFTKEASADLSIEILKNAQALADWTGLPIESAVDAQTKALLGEREMMKSFGVVITDQEVQMGAWAKAGVKSAKEFSALPLSVQQQSKALATNDIIIAKSTDALNGFAEGSLTTSQKVNKAWTSIKQTLENIYNNYMKPILDSIADKLVELSEKFENLDESGQQAFFGLLVGVTALAPLLIILGKIISIGAMLFNVFNKLKLAMAGLQAGASVASLGASGLVASMLPVIGIILAVVAVVIVLYTQFEGFREIVDVVIQSVIEIIQSFLDAFIPVIDQIIATFQQLWGIIQPILESIINILGVIIPPILDVLVAVFKFAFGIIAGVIQVFLGIIQFFGSLIKSVFDIIGNVLNVWIGVWKSVFKTVSNVIDGIIGFVKDLKNNIVSIFNSLKDILVEPFNQAKDIIMDVFQGIIDFITDIPGKVGNALANLGSSVSNALGDLNPFFSMSPNYQSMLQGSQQATPMTTVYNTWNVTASKNDLTYSGLDAMKNRARFINGGEFI